VTPRGRGTRVDRGQSTVELALVLPLAVALLLLVVQVGLVVRDDVLVVHAAREGARAAAVGLDDAKVRAAVVGAGPLRSDRLHVQVARTSADGGQVVVTVRYRSVTDLPLVGALVPDVELVERVRMRAETP
jgi:Flp pilus assembly protein TadG